MSKLEVITSKGLSSPKNKYLRESKKGFNPRDVAGGSNSEAKVIKRAEV